MSSWNWFQIGRVSQDLEFSGRDFTRWDPYLVWSEFGSPRLRKRWVCAWRSGVTAGDPHVQKLARDREKEVTYFIRVYFGLIHSDWWWNTLDVWIKTRRHCSADSWVFSFFFSLFSFFLFFLFFLVLWSDWTSHSLIKGQTWKERRHFECQHGGITYSELCRGRVTGNMTVYFNVPIISVQKKSL